MAKLSSPQATNLANNFLGLARAIGDFIYENSNTLSKADNKRLESLHWSILNYSEDILALSTALVMDDIETSLLQLDDVTTQIKGTIKNLRDIQKGINVAAAIVTLGAAIINENPQIIGQSLRGVVDVWKA